MEEAIVVGSIGLWRKFLKESLENDGIKLICFVDTVEAGTSYKEVPIVSPEDLPKHAKDFKGLVLVTFPINDEKRKQFFTYVMKHIGSCSRILNFNDVYKRYKDALIRAKEIGDLWLGENYDKNRAVNAVDFLSDEKSKDILKSWIEFRETLDIDYVIEPEEPQYFPKDLAIYRFVPEECSLLDLGAFTGNSYLFLRKKLSEFSKRIVLYVGVEADQENFLKLTRTVEMDNGDEKIVLLNTACFSKNTYLEFIKTGTDRSSYIDVVDMEIKSERVTLIATKLDVALRNFKFDIIKADIEGAELECLKGMTSIIKSSRPVMMISLYHKPADIYEILEFVRNELDNYDLYVRVHSAFFINTILYAIPRS